MRHRELTRRLRAYYDRTPSYHSFHADDPAPNASDPYDQALQQYLRPDDRVLDLAGGSGWLRTRLPELPYWLIDMSLEALRQARDGAGGRTPIVVLSEVRQGVKAQRYVLLSLKDWLAWHGETL